MVINQLLCYGRNIDLSWIFRSEDRHAFVENICIGNQLKKGKKLFKIKKIASDRL